LFPSKRSVIHFAIISALFAHMNALLHTTWLSRTLSHTSLHHGQFHVAVQQLREKSAKERQNTSHSRHEMEMNHTHEEDLNARWQMERVEANNTLQQEREERHANRAKVTAQYCELSSIHT
jgi:hypothetical protein